MATLSVAQPTFHVYLPRVLPREKEGELKEGHISATEVSPKSQKMKVFFRTVCWLAALFVGRLGWRSVRELLESYLEGQWPQRQARLVAHPPEIACAQKGEDDQK